MCTERSYVHTSMICGGLLYVLHVYYGKSLHYISEHLHYSSSIRSSRLVVHGFWKYVGGGLEYTTQSQAL